MALTGAWIRLRGGRSNGVRVKGATLHHIRQGDAARDRRDWEQAAAHYRKALKRTAALPHIWVQLGHALKETGDRENAAEAYRQAASLAPRDREAWLRLGHLLKRDGNVAGATGSFLEVLNCCPDDLEATVQLLLLAPDESDRSGLRADIFRAVGISLSATGHPSATELAEDATLFEITDLVTYFGQARLPTGIQRVQIELLLATLTSGTGVVPVPVVYAAGQRGWVALPAAVLVSLCQASMAGDERDDPSWRASLKAVHQALACAGRVTFGRGALLLNLGTTLSDPSHLDAVRAARQAAGLQYVAYVHDVIPLLHPEWFVPSSIADFNRWLIRLLTVADGYIAVSRCTRSDLLAIAQARNVPVAPPLIRVVPQNGDFRRHSATRAKEPTLAALGLSEGGYVLFVSTLEPRKNHVGAIAAWRRLIEELGESDVPELVCVGGTGWLNADVHEALARDPLLRRKVRLLSGIADDTLAVLYSCCRFTLYPSFYEGWGLPISESLSYGKVPALSDTSAMPEAGGKFGVYFDPHDVSRMTAELKRLIVDDRYREKLERSIRECYASRSWSAIAEQLLGEIGNLRAHSKLGLKTAGKH